MTRGHFLAFLSQACGILQTKIAFEICPLSPYYMSLILFSLPLFPLPPLVKVKKKETNACLLPPLCSNQTEFPAKFVFNPGLKAFGVRKRALTCVKKMSAVEIILRDSGKCLRTFIFTHVNVRKFVRDSGNPR